MASHMAESNRLWLQEINAEDHLEGLFALQSDPKVMQWSSRPRHETLDDTHAFIEKCLPTTDEPWHKRYAIMLRPDPEVEEEKPVTIGLIGSPRGPEIAYSLRSDYWGKGYMSAAITMFLELWWGLQRNLKFKHLLAFTDCENLPSQRVLEKAGFKRGRVFKDHYVLGVNKGSGKKSSLQEFYLQRTGTAPYNEDDLGLLNIPGPHSNISKEVVSQDDVASIKETLANDGIKRINRAL